MANGMAPQTYIGQPTQYYGMARRPDYSAITGAQSGLPLYALKQQEEEEAATAARHKAEMELAKENIEIAKQGLVDLAKYRQQGLDVSAQEMKLYKEIADLQRTSTKSMETRALEQQAAEAKRAQFVSGLQTGISALGTGYQIGSALKLWPSLTSLLGGSAATDTVLSGAMAGSSSYAGGAAGGTSLGAAGGTVAGGAVAGGLGAGGVGAGGPAAGTIGSYGAAGGTYGYGAGLAGGAGAGGASGAGTAAGVGAGMSTAAVAGPLAGAVALKWTHAPIQSITEPVFRYLLGDDKGYTPEEDAYFVSSGGAAAQAQQAPAMAYNVNPGMGAYSVNPDSPYFSVPYTDDRYRL